MENTINSLHVFSIYDSNSDRDSKYITRQQFYGFNGHRIQFGMASLVKGIRSDVVILSHINLLFIALLIKTISPKTRIILYAHGIEVWRKLRSWKCRFLINKCEIWAVSKYTSDKLEEVHKIPSEHIKVIPNCLDPFLEIPSTFDKPKELLKRYNLTADQPLIFTLTRLSSHERYKGYDGVIETLPVLIKIYPTIHYLLAGSADQEEQTRLEKLIEKLNIKKHITLTGFISDEELTDHFLLADIFIMPSRKEGFGIVFIEAATCGCKVIGGDQDGTVDALLNGRLGTLVNPFDKNSILKAIDDNLKLNRSNESSQAIQNLCLEHFSYQQYLQKIQGLLSSK